MRHVIISFILAVLMAHQTLGQKRQGYIDCNKVMVTFPQYALEQKRLETRTKELNDSLKVLYTEFQDKIKSSVDYPQTRTDEAKIYIQKEIQKLQDMHKKLYEFRDKVESEVKQLRDEIHLNMRRIITMELLKFSTDSAVICVLDKKAILYCNYCVDFTDEFINYCKSKRR